MFLLDFQNLTVLFSLLVHATLLFVLLRHGKRDKVSWFYSFAILAIAFWIFPMALYRSHFLGLTEFWARLLYAMATFTSTTFFLFTLHFPRTLRFPSFFKWFLFFENIFILFLCFHPSWMIQGVQIVTGGEDIIFWGPLYFLYALPESSNFWM